MVDDQVVHHSERGLSLGRGCVACMSLQTIAAIENKHVPELQRHLKSPPPTTGFSRVLLMWQVAAWAAYVNETVHAQQVHVEVPQNEGRFGWQDAVQDGKYLI